MNTLNESSLWYCNENIQFMHSTIFSIDCCFYLFISILQTQHAIDSHGTDHKSTWNFWHERICERICAKNMSYSSVFMENASEIIW